MENQPSISVTPLGCCSTLIKIDCNGVKCEKNGCSFAEETGPKKQLSDPGDSDLSNVKVEDWVYTLWGWKQVTAILDKHYYPVRIGENNFTYDGKYQVSHIHPSAWIRPPAFFNAPPKPQSKPIFKKGDRVLVRDEKKEKWIRRYFSHYDFEKSSPYCCFKFGRDDWVSNGETNNWKFCKKWEE